MHINDSGRCHVNDFELLLERRRKSDIEIAKKD
jgi:hypothetical protein